MAKAIITLTHGESDAEMAQLIQGTDSTGLLREHNKLISYVQSLQIGSRKATMEVLTGAAQATGTFTFASIANTDTLVINGVTFTAKTSPATAYEFAVGASDTAAAANAAAAINASTDAQILNIVTATSALGVVTITAYRAGVSGNAITLTGGTHVTASGARLTTGADGTVVTYLYGT